MSPYSRTRFWTEAVAAVASASVFLLTLVEPQWFEVLFDEAPDGGDGSLETWIALACSFAATILFARLARLELRRRASQDSSA
jgi:hypothetical protein